MQTTLPDSIKNILVLRPDRLGDVILTLPVIRNLKNTYPDAKITYLCTEYTSHILRYYELISDIIIYDPKKTHKNYRGIWQLFKQLERYNFDIAIHLLPKFPLALATYIANIKYSIGTGFRWFSFLYTHRFYEHRKYNLYHEAEYNLHLLSKLGIDDTCIPDVYSYFKFPAEIENAIKKVIVTKFQNKPFIIIHPGSGGSAIDWPIENYSELLKLLNDWGEYAVGITGIFSEREFLEPLYTSGMQFVDFIDKFDLNQLSMLLRNARLLISNSTGPLHLAVAMGTPVLGLYPNSPGQGPKRWGPYMRPELQYMTPPIDRAYPTTHESNNIMRNIRPELVLERIKKILSTQ
jgi:heptosyltransferase-2